MKIACCQTKPLATKEETLNHIEKLISTAKPQHATVFVLPEMFICPYEYDAFAQYSEPSDGFIVQKLSYFAKKYGMYIFGGTIPEKVSDNSGDKIYNTAFVFDKNGDVIGKYRKKHLFDIDIKDKISFKESDYLTAGEETLVVEIEGFRFGVGICFDVRFPEEFSKMRAMGADVFILPASFNMTTGPVHWELLLRARALDNQCYLVACAGALEQNSSYHSYGHSMIVNPWGEVVCECEQQETILYHNINKDFIANTRQSIPLGMDN